jgi:hypothetical protein
MTKFIHYIYQVPVPSYYTKYQCCGSETFYFGSGSGFRSDLKYLLFLKEYDFKGPKMAF